MNLGVRTILLLVAVVCSCSRSSPTTRRTCGRGGLAAFAGAFLADALGWADRTFGTPERRDTT
jgi:hypothetical protein